MPESRETHRELTDLVVEPTPSLGPGDLGGKRDLPRRRRWGRVLVHVHRGPAQPQSTVTISTGSDVPLSVTVRGSEIGNLPSVAVALLAKISSPLASAAIRAAS